MPESLMDLLANPLVWKVIVGYWLFSAFVGALRTPDSHSSEVYQFVFRFSHLLSGNVNRAALVFKVPGVESQEEK